VNAGKLLPAHLPVGSGFLHIVLVTGRQAARLLNVFDSTGEINPGY